MIPRALAVLALCLTAACSSTSIYQMRGTEEPWDPGPDFTVEKLEKDRNAQLNLEARSIEDFRDFDLGVIEITEEGFVNPEQQRQVMDMVRTRLTDTNALLIVFAHGWHHGARVCDTNLTCFRRVLERFATAPDLKRLGVKVTGVYIGWRGESWRGKASVLTSWGRKRVGEHIGRTGAKEVLLELDRIHNEAKNKYRKPYMTMITVGHSLGGGLIYSAMKGIATGDAAGIIAGSRLDQTYRVVRAEGDRTKVTDTKAIRARLGDLVVLVNPAIEASEYRPFNADLPESTIGNYRPPPDRKLKYDADQLPVLLAIGSEADWAVGKTFVLGQVLAGFRHPSYFKDSAKLIGIGHYEDHITHTLQYDAEERRKEEAIVEAAEKEEARTTPQPECDCPYDFESMIQDITEDPLRLDSKEVQTFGKLTYALKNPATWDPHTPYIVVRANPGVLTGHNDIYNPVFMSYLSKFIRAYIAKSVKIHYDEASR